MATVATNFMSWLAVKENVSILGCRGGARFCFNPLMAKEWMSPPTGFSNFS